jgi:ABC-type branched-subunit amino acid transport system substrate-binding protein
MTIRLLLQIPLLLLVTLAQAQEEGRDPSEALFRSALTQFREGKYGAAVQGFDQLLARYPSSPQVTGALVMKGKALYQMGENLEAARAARRLLTEHPSSLYIADAHLLLGLTYGRVGRSLEAMSEFAAAWEHRPRPSPTSLDRSILAALDSIIDPQISVIQIQDAIVFARDSVLRAYLWVKKGEKEADRENMLGVALAIDTLGARYAGHPFDERVEGLRGRLAGSARVVLAALLPLMEGDPPSVTREIAQEVLGGIQYAVDEHAADPGSRTAVTLRIFDSKRDPARVDSIVRRLGKETAVAAIIGPVFSSAAMTAAVAAQSVGVPLVSPTANANGISAAGEFVFQANPDYENRGAAMARYVVQECGLRRIAVLAPTNGYGRFQADGFLRESKRLGATVVAEAWYPKGGSDLKEQFVTIRKASLVAQSEPMISFAGKFTPTDIMRLVDLGVPRKKIDSLLNKAAILPATELLGPEAGRVMDSVGLSPTYDLTKLDSLQYPSLGVQAMYIPISEAGEIGVVSAQFAYYNIQARLFGSGEWNDLAELHEHKRYCNGVTFESDSYVDTSLATVRGFISGYAKKFGKEPTRNVYYGFDAASLVLSKIRAGASTRTALARSLAATTDHRALHTRVGFTPKRVNGWLTILQFSDDALGRLAEIRIE